MRTHAHTHTHTRSVIVDKIDEDSDGFINLYELQTWIKYSQSRYIDRDVSAQWKVYNLNASDQLHWEVSVFFCCYCRRHTRGVLMGTSRRGLVCVCVWLVLIALTQSDAGFGG